MFSSHLQAASLGQSTDFLTTSPLQWLSGAREQKQEPVAAGCFSQNTGIPGGSAQKHRFHAVFGWSHVSGPPGDPGVPRVQPGGMPGYRLYREYTRAPGRIGGHHLLGSCWPASPKSKVSWEHGRKPRISSGDVACDVHTGRGDGCCNLGP